MISRSPVTLTTYLPAFSPSVSGITTAPLTLTAPTFLDCSLDSTVKAIVALVNTVVGIPSTAISLATVTVTWWAWI